MSDAGFENVTESNMVILWCDLVEFARGELSSRGDGVCGMR